MKTDTNRTVLITGTSSGIGRATVEYFAGKGWNVAATMRNPEKGKDLLDLGNVKLYSLDVTNQVQIQDVIKSVLSDFGQIDALVNNAGYPTIGIFEKGKMEQIQKQFDTNVFGVMKMTKAVLPHFRQRRQGTIINITSVGGIVTFPIYSTYHSTKWAVEGFSESLRYELKPFNIKVKCVEPGAIKTDFYSRSEDKFEDANITDYDHYQDVAIKNSQAFAANAPGPEVVAKTIYKAAVSNNFRLRYAVGSFAPQLIFIKKFLPRLFFFLVGLIVERGIKSK